MQGKKTNLTRVIFAKIYKHGLSQIVFALALLFGLIAVNYVIAVKSPQFDVTRNRVNSLSRETVKLLGQINSDITVKAFYMTSSQRRISQLFDKYTQKNKHLKVEFIDPIKNPVLADLYEVTNPGTIIFETAEKKTRINPNTAGRPHGEREITIALYRILNQETLKAYFTTGHGELSLANTRRDGISTVEERLTEQNYVVDQIILDYALRR